MLVGLGAEKEIDAEKLRRAAAIGIKAAEDQKAAGVTVHVSDAIAKLAGGPGADVDRVDIKGPAGVVRYGASTHLHCRATENGTDGCRGEP